jgi:hypothetical protein
MPAGDELLVVRHDKSRAGSPCKPSGRRPLVGTFERPRWAPRGPGAGRERRALGAIRE